MRKVLTGLAAAAAVVSAFAADTVLDVAEGVVFTNTTALVAETANLDKLVKRGKGTYYADCCVGVYSQDGTARKFAELVVEEGTMILHCGCGSFGNCRLGKITVRSGARLRCEIKSGKNALSQFYRDAPSVATIEEGGVFDVNGADIRGDQTTMSYAGEGTLLNANASHLGPYFTDFTGDLVHNLNYYLQPSFGDASDAANDFDWSRIRSFVVSNSYVCSDAERVRAHFKIAGTHYFDKFPMTTSFAVKTNKSGSASYVSAYFYNNATFEDFTAERIRPLLNTATSHLTVNGGRSTLAGSINITDGASFTMNGGRISSTDTSQSDRNRYYNSNLYDGSTLVGSVQISHINFQYGKITSSRNQAEFNLNGGVIYGGDHTKRTWLNGGKVYRWNAIYAKGTTYHTNCWNGAKVYMWINDSAAFTCAIDRGDSPVTYLVGENGGWFETQGTNNGPNVPFEICWKSACPDGVADGGLRMFGRHKPYFTVQPEFRGPYEVNTYIFGMSSGTRDSDHLFGYGNLVLGNTRLSSWSAGTAYRLAGGPGAKLVLRGVPELLYTAATTDANARNLVVGPSGATVSSIAREPGGALFLKAESSSFSIGTYSSFKVEGGVEKNGVGLPKVPVFQVHNSDYGVTSGHVTFTDYDDEKGYVPYSNYMSSFGNQVTDVVYTDSVRMKVLSDTVVGALRLNIHDNTFYTDDPTNPAANLYITNGVTLTVGDGVNPATVVMNSTGGHYLSSIKGDGTLAFGGSEAVFAMNGRGAIITCPISADNGVSFVGNNSAYALLYHDQDWTTTVHANRCRLVPKTNLALGTGRLVLGTGWNHGGVLDLSTPGLVLSNPITMGGFGLGAGAIVVSTNATLTGDIDFYGAATVGVSGRTAELTLAGEMSGDDNLVLKNYGGNSYTLTKTADKVYDVTEVLAREKNGRVVVTGSNEGYLGDVWVIRTTLVLKGPSPGLGTGEITLDAGALRLENTKPVRVRGRVAGAGKITLASRELVTFDDLHGQNSTIEPQISAASGYTLNLTNGKDESKFDLEVDSNNAAINSLKGVREITTTHTGAVHLSIPDDAPGSFTGTVAPNVVLHYGLIYRPGFTILVW